MLRLRERFAKEFNVHAEPLGGELGACVLLLGVLGSMWIVTAVTIRIEHTDGHHWPTFVRWLCNARLSLVLTVPLVAKCRRLYHELTKPWGSEAHEQSQHARREKRSMPGWRIVILRPRISRVRRAARNR